jgi:hypothetical protein
VEVHDAGRLHLATGRLVACDPFSASGLSEDTAAFTVTVPYGRRAAGVAALAAGPP